MTCQHHDSVLTTAKAIIRSSECYHNKQPHHAEVGAIFRLTTGAIFLGTPHRGSSKASLGKVAAIAGKMLGAHDRILRALECDSDMLEQQRESFDCVRQSFVTVCLWEDTPVPIIGTVRNDRRHPGKIPPHLFN